MSTITQTSQQSDESPQQHSFSLQIMNSIFHIQLTQFSRSTLIYICDSSHPSVDSVSASVLFDKVCFFFCNIFHSFCISMIYYRHSCSSRDLYLIYIAIIFHISNLFPANYLAPKTLLSKTLLHS